MILHTLTYDYEANNIFPVPVEHDVMVTVTTDKSGYHVTTAKTTTYFKEECDQTGYLFVLFTQYPQDKVFMTYVNWINVDWCNICHSGVFCFIKGKYT